MDINFLPKQFRPKSLYRKLFTKQIQASLVVIFLGLMALSTIQTHASIANPAANELTKIKSVSLAQSYAQAATDNITQVVFGPNTDTNKVNSVLDKQTRLITTRPTFFAALGVVQKNESTIKQEAAAAGVPQDVAIGVAFLENGGSESATSVAGARGIYQFMPSTARGYGLVVASYQDDRLDPAKATHAAMQYLAGNYQTLKDWGLSIWSYHAGAGNVCKAVQIYAAAHGQILGSGCPDSIGNYVQAQQLTADKLLSDPSVQSQLANKLKDDSAGYVYKVMTDANIYNLVQNIGTSELAKRASSFNSQIMNISQVFAS